MALPLLPTSGLDDVNFIRRVRETINGILTFTFDDSRRQTKAEKLAGVTPLNTAYPPGYLRRYGAAGDGSTDDSAAVTRAIAVSAQGQVLYGTPGDIYKLSSAVSLGATFDLDLQGSTIMPSGNHLTLNSTISATATATINATINIGTRTCTVSSATGLAVGQWTFITYNDSPTNQSVSYPPSWARIVSIVGTTITFDRAFQVSYASGASTFTLNAFNDTTMHDFCRIRNGILDGTNSTYSGATLGVAMRIMGYKEVDLDKLTFRNWSITGVNDDLITIFQCVRARVSISDIGNDTAVAQHINFVDVMDAASHGCTHDGGGFGIGFLRCDAASAQANYLNGRRRRDSDDAVSPGRSVRGIKAYGCKHVRVIGNHVADYESPIKIEACHGGIVALNELTNCELGGAFTGSNALNVGQTTDGNQSGYFVITGNTVINGNGNGIAVTSSSVVGRVIIANNVVRSVQGYGIYCIVPNSIITGNQVADWGLRNSSDEAIYHDSGTTCTGNRFYHATLTTLPCIRATLVSNFWYDFRDNASISGNPLFTGSKVAEFAFGTTLSTANQSQTLTHNLLKTPGADEIWCVFGSKPTNAPRMVYWDTITATQATVHIDGDPGATSLTCFGRITLKMPFQA